jgi:hypothetical protein
MASLTTVDYPGMTGSYRSTMYCLKKFAEEFRGNLKPGASMKREELKELAQDYPEIWEKYWEKYYGGTG